MYNFAEHLCELTGDDVLDNSPHVLSQPSSHLNTSDMQVAKPDSGVLPLQDTLMDLEVPGQRTPACQPSMSYESAICGTQVIKSGPNPALDNYEDVGHYGLGNFPVLRAIRTSLSPTRPPMEPGSRSGRAPILDENYDSDHSIQDNEQKNHGQDSSSMSSFACERAIVIKSPKAAPRRSKKCSRRRGKARRRTSGSFCPADAECPPSEEGDWPVPLSTGSAVLKESSHHPCPVDGPGEEWSASQFHYDDEINYEEDPGYEEDGGYEEDVDYEGDVAHEEDVYPRQSNYPNTLFHDWQIADSPTSRFYNDVGGNPDDLVGNPVLEFSGQLPDPQPAAQDEPKNPPTSSPTLQEYAQDSSDSDSSGGAILIDVSPPPSPPPPPPIRTGTCSTGEDIDSFLFGSDAPAAGVFPTIAPTPSIPATLQQSTPVDIVKRTTAQETPFRRPDFAVYRPILLRSSASVAAASSADPGNYSAGNTTFQMKIAAPVTTATTITATTATTAAPRQLDDMAAQPENRNPVIVTSSPPRQPRNAKNNRNYQRFPVDDNDNNVWPKPKLRQGDVSPEGMVFTPWKSIKAYPTYFIQKEHRASLDDYFCKEDIGHRTWDFYYLSHPTKPDRNVTTFVPIDQFLTFLDYVSAELEMRLTMPIGNHLEKFRMRFGQDDTPRPRYLGRSVTPNDLEDLHQMGDRGLLPRDFLRLNAGDGGIELGRKLDLVYDSGRSKPKKGKKAEERRAARVIHRVAWGRQTKRVQRYLGLRSAHQTTPRLDLDIDLTQPLSLPCEKDVVFISADVECYEMNHSLITEVGLAVFDSRHTCGVAPGELGENWFSFIHARHLRIREHSWAVNSKHVQGCPDLFGFGKSEFVPLAEAAQIVRNAVESTSRNVVWVFHDPYSDIQYLKSLGYNIYHSKNPIEIVDTRTMHQHLRRLPNALKLLTLLMDLGFPSRNLHNAGNDAVYTMQAMIGLAIKKRLQSLGRHQQQQAAESDAEKNEKEPQSNPPEEGWSTGGEDTDGGAAGPFSEPAVQVSKKAQKKNKKSTPQVVW